MAGVRLRPLRLRRAPLIAFEDLCNRSIIRAAEIVTERRMMFRGIVDWTMIVLAIIGGLWISSTMRSADPKRRAASQLGLEDAVAHRIQY